MPTHPYHSLLIQWQPFQSWIHLFLSLTTVRKKMLFFSFSFLSGDYLFPLILSDNLRKELSSYLTRFGTMQRKIFFSFKLSSWETDHYSHSSPSFWLCVLGAKTKEEVMFFRCWDKACRSEPSEHWSITTQLLVSNLIFPAPPILDFYYYF